MELYYCKKTDRYFSSLQGFINHVIRKNVYSSIEEAYINEVGVNNNKCKFCGNPTSFISFSKGYRTDRCDSKYCKEQNFKESYKKNLVERQSNKSFVEFYKENEKFYLDSFVPYNLSIFVDPWNNDSYPVDKIPFRISKRLRINEINDLMCEDIKCDQCGQIFRKNKYAKKREGSKLLFCNQECRLNYIRNKPKNRNKKVKVDTKNTLEPSTLNWPKNTLWIDDVNTHISIPYFIDFKYSRYDNYMKDYINFYYNGDYMSFFIQNFREWIGEIFICKKCGSEYIRDYPFSSKKFTQSQYTCSKKCYIRLLKEDKHNYYQYSEETRVKQSKTIKDKILAGKFTPCSTNSWCNSRIEEEFNGIKYFFRSSWECAFHYLHRDFQFESIRLKYYNTDKGEESVYIVDFFDKERGILYEIKPSSNTNKQEFKDKEKAALEFCYQNNYTYIVLSETYFIEKNDELMGVLKGKKHEELILKRMKTYLK